MIPAGATSFTANGKMYHKSESVSFNRHKWLSKLQVELSYGTTVDQLFESQKKQYELLNKQKFADAAVLAHNTMKGIASIADDRAPVAMKLALLFWNYEGEDVRFMTNELMAEKLADMEQEGVDAGFFFAQALSCVPGFISAYTQSKGILKGE